jgi:hypothetical protein
MANMLSNKFGIAVQTRELKKSSNKQVSFYLKYSSSVLRALKKPLFQKFLRWMLRRENIEEDTVGNVQIKVFPFRKNDDRGLAGKCNVKNGEIHIYPKRLKSCQKLIQECGKEKFVYCLKRRARAALIHELLHLKYANDEETVRHLTKKYSSIFARAQKNQT